MKDRVDSSGLNGDWVPNGCYIGSDRASQLTTTSYKPYNIQYVTALVVDHSSSGFLA